MARFALMLRDNGFPNDLSPDEMQAIFDRYRAWSRKVGRKGGEKLKNAGGKVMKRGSVTDGPYVS